MIAFPAGVKVWIAGGVTDMRCGMNSLALKVQQGWGDQLRTLKCGRLGLVEKVSSGVLLVDRRGMKLPVSRFHDLRFPPHPNFPGAEDVFSRMQTAPKFVFSRDLIDWLVEHSGDYAHAVAVAINVGRTELPYDTMLVEWRTIQKNAYSG